MFSGPCIIVFIGKKLKTRVGGVERRLTSLCFLIEGAFPIIDQLASRRLTGRGFFVFVINVVFLSYFIDGDKFSWLSRREALTLFAV